MNSMYETLQTLPLFKGVSADKISEIIGKTRFHFLTITMAKQLLKQVICVPTSGR